MVTHSQEEKMPKPEDKITMTFRLPRSIHRSLRKLASDEQRTIETVTTRAIVAEIAKARIEDEIREAAR